MSEVIEGVSCMSEKELVSRLEDLIKREEILIPVMNHASCKEDASDLEKDLREIRDERKDIVHRLGVIRRSALKSDRSID